MHRIEMDVSVIICTWNNANRLATTLDAIRGCRVPDGMLWELIVVNNNCTDDTDRIIEKFAGTLPVRCVHEPKQGLSHARNGGVQAASGEFVIFTDDDVKPARDWIVSYWQSYRQKPTGYYFGGPVQSEFEGEAPDLELLCLAPPSVRGLDLGREARILTPREFFIGPNWACPIQAIKRAGGFDPEKGLNPARPRVRIGEETDLMQRLNQLGLSACYVPAAQVIHAVPASKCTLAHIAERVEAYGEYAAAHIFCARVPLWMYRMAVRYWLKWLGEKALGRKGYLNYVAWREMVGRIRAINAKPSEVHGSTIDDRVK